MTPSIRKALTALADDISALEARLTKALDGLRRTAHQIQGDKERAEDLAAVRRALDIAQPAMVCANGLQLQLREIR